MLLACLHILASSTVRALTLRPAVIPCLSQLRQLWWCAVLNSCVQVSSDDAVAMARRLATEEGLLTGISSGAAVVAALEVRVLISGCRKTQLSCYVHLRHAIFIQWC
jgi:threonine synthase